MRFEFVLALIFSNLLLPFIDGSFAIGHRVYHFAFRFYDPKIGRFVAADSIVPDPENGEAFNRYAYTYNNPIKFKDPSGHVPNDWLKMAWERIRSGMGWDNDSPSYGYTREDHIYGQAMNFNSQEVLRGVAGVAASTREFEFQVGAAYAAGIIDFYYYADSLFLHSRVLGHRPPSEALFEVVALDPANEPGYWIPYGLGLVTGAGTIVVPAGRSALGLLRRPRTAPTPQPGVQPRPGQKPPHSDPSHPDYPPVIAGGSPGSRLPNFKHSPEGTKVAFILDEVTGGLVAYVGTPAGPSRLGTPMLSVQEYMVVRIGPSGRPVLEVLETPDSKGVQRFSERVWEAINRGRGADMFEVGDDGELIPDGVPSIDYDSFFAQPVVGEG